MAETTPEGERTTLPLFPLQTVLLPGAYLPLHIFEPRYRQLTVDLMTDTVPDRQFGVLAVRTSLVREVENLEHVHEVGCAALLREAKRLPDGRFDIITTGQRRFRLRSIDCTSAPYLLGDVEWLDDLPLPSEGAETARELGEAARAAHRRYCSAAWERQDWQLPSGDTDLTELAYVLAADCVLPLPDRQALLEERQPLRRLHLACRLLNREAGFLTTLRAVPPSPGELTGPAKPAHLN